MASDLIQLVEDLRAGKKIREETVLGNVIRSSDPDASRIPVLRNLSRLGWTWEMQQYKFTLDDNSVEQIQKLREGRTAALSFGREDTLTDIYAWDRNNKPLGYGALEQVGLQITRPRSASVGKRLSRLLQPYAASGVFNDLKIAEFDVENELDWDGMYLTSQSMFNRLIAPLPSQQAAELMKYRRFSGTMMWSPEGLGYQNKGHTMVIPDYRMPEGADIAIPRGSYKREIAYNHPGGVFVGLMGPAKSHRKLDVDVQSWINHFRYVIPDTTAYGWIAEDAQEFISQLASGQYDERMMDIFSGVSTQEEFDARTRLGLYRYIASGGRTTDSPYMTREAAGMYIKNRFGERHDKLRVPVPGGFNLYVASEAIMRYALGEDAPRLTGNEVYSDFATSSIYLSNEFARQALPIMGGGDYDDNLVLLPNQRNEILMQRQPNAQREMVIGQLINPEDPRRHGIKPRDFDFSPIRELLSSPPKQYQLSELDPIGIPEGYSYPQIVEHMLPYWAKSANRLGIYINALSAQTLTFGHELNTQVAPQEKIIDRFQKEVGDMTPVYNWMRDSLSMLIDYPLAEEAIRRLKGVNQTANAYYDEKGRRKVPPLEPRVMPYHPVDEMREVVYRTLVDVANRGESLASQASFPLSVISQVQPGDRGAKMSDAYFKFLREHNYDYDLAQRTMARTVGKMDPQERNQTILQALIGASTPKGFRNDRWLFGDFRQEGQQEPTMRDYTFEALMSVGHLQEPVFGVLPQSNSETMVTLAVDDAWAQFVRQNYVGADLKNPELKSEAEARFARQAQYLKSRSVQIANQRVLDDRGNVLGTVGDIHKGELYGLTGGLIANSQVRYNRLFLSLFDPAFTPQPEIDQEKSSQFHLDPYGAALSGMDPSGLPAYQRRTLEFLNQYIDTRNSDPFYEMSRTVASDLDTYANWMVEGWEAPENVHPTVFNALVKRATALAKEQGRGFQPPSLRSEVNAPAPVALPAPEMNERLTQRQGYIAGMPRSQFAARAANYVTARYVEGGKASEADLGNVWRWNYYAITKNPEWKLGDPLFQLEGRRQKAVDTSPKLPDFIREKGEASDLALVRGAMQNPERWKMVFPENANPPKATAERHLFRAPRSVSQERIDASNNARAWEEIFGRYGVVTQQLTRGMTEGEIESLGEPVDNDFGQLAVGSRDVNSRLFGVRGTYDVGSDEIYVDRSNLYTLKNSLRLAQSLKSRGGWQDRYLSSPSQDILSMISYDRGVYYHELGHRVHTQMPDVFDRFSGAIEKQRDVLKGISGRYASGRFLSSSDNRLEVIPEEEFAHQYALSRVSPEIQQMYYPAFGEFFQNERANIDRFLAENPASAYLVDTTGGPVPIRNLSSRSSNRLLSSSAQNKRYLFEAPNGSPRPPDNFPPESNRVPRGVFSSNEDGPQPFQFSDAYEGQYADADTLWEEAQRGNPNAIGALPEDMRSNSQERIASGGNVPRGWKLHFTTDDPESLSAYLSQRGYSHKVGRNSGQTGKDVTAYIGGLDDALEAAADIGVGARDLLKQPEGNVLSDDLPLLPNVMGRFDPRDQEFAQYGAKGYPHLRGDVINVLYGGMTREQADERAKARLTEKYGTLFTGEPLGSGQTPLDTIISESQERIASGGGVGGPPEEPPIAEDQFYEPEDEPPDGGRRSPHTERPAMEGKAREAISRGESFILNVATGGGKTGVMGAAMDEAFDRMGGGLSIAVSPLTKINEKNAVAFDEEQRRRLGIDPQTGEDIMGPQVGFFLPGHPGEGAPPEKLEAYNAAHKAVYDALGIEFDPRRGMTISGKGRIKKVGEGFEWQGDPMILTMSIEKLAASPKTRMGKVLQFLGKNQMLGMLNVDEAHGLLSDSRYMGRYLRDTWEGYAPGRPVGMVSGSLTPESRDTLRRAWNVDPRNVSVFPATEANRVSYIGAEVGSSYTDDPEAAKALAGFLEGDQPAFLFTDRIERMRDIEKQVKARGSKPFVIHSGQKGDLTPEEIELGNQKIREGLEPGDVAVASGVVGTGVHRPEVGQGAMYNPYDMETLIQGLGRVRSPEGDQPDRRRGIFATPGTYFYRAGEISKTGQRLEDMSYMAGLYTHLRSNEARYNKNWQVAAGEMSSRVGARLKEDKLSPGLSQNVIEYLHEAGLITLDSVTDGESSYFGFAFAERGDVSRVAQRLSEAQLKSRSQIDTDTGDYRKVSVADRVREDADLKSREQQAMGRLFHQAFRNTSSPEDAGKVIQQAAITYQNEGLKGLERLVDVDLPRDLAKRFVENLTAATENLGRLAKEGGSVADALTDTDQSIKRTREQTIGGNPKATRFAAGMLLNEAAAAYQRGNDYAGDTYRNEAEFLNRSANEGVPGGVPAFDESGRDMGKGKGGFRANMSRALLYSLFMDRRLWQYTIGAELQQATRVDDWALPAMYGGGFDYGTSISGFRPRFEAGQQFLARGSFQQVGAFAELPYAVSGMPFGDNLGRLSSAGRISAGIGSFGLSGAAMMGMMGMSQTATLGVAGAGVGLGLAAFGVGLGAETVNLVTGREGRRALTLDSLVRNSALGLTIFPQALTGNAAGARARVEALREENPQWYNFIMQGADPTTMQKEKDVQDFAEKLATSVPGTTAQQYTGILSQMGRFMGGWKGNEDRLRGFFQAAPRLGYAPDELAQTFLGTASALNIAPGSFQYQSLMDQFAQAQGPGDIFALQNDASRASQFASQLGYYTGGVAGSNIVATYGVDRVSEAQNLQRAYGQFDTFGLDLNKVVRTDRSTEMRRRTTGYFEPGQKYEGPDVDIFNGFNNLGNLIRWNVTGKKLTDIKLGEEGGYRTKSRYEEVAVDKPVTFAEALAEIQNKYPDYGGQIFNLATGTFGSTLASLGFNEGEILNFTDALGGYFQGRGLTPYQMDLSTKALFDPRAASYTSWKYPDLISGIGMSVAGTRVWDTSGNPVYETSGSAFIQMAQAQAMGGNQAAQALTGYSDLFKTTFSPEQIAGQLGIQPNRMATYMQSGTRGVIRDIRSDLHANAMASIGLQFEQIANQRNYLWGSGTFDQPGAGSMWFFEDQLRDLSHRSTMADFTATEKKREISRRQTEDQDRITGGRMDLNSAWQLYTLQFERQGQLIAREWQDTTRGLQWQWKTEDFGEEVRFMTGRQRRLAERDMGRATTMHNLENDQIAKNREREDEFYQKKSEYIKALIGLDQEQFEKSKKDRQELWALEDAEFARKKAEYAEEKQIRDQITELQRKHQAEQLDFQERSAGIAASNLALQKELDEVNQKNSQWWSDIRGELEQINQYDNVTNVVTALTNMADKMTGLDPAILQKLIDVLDRMSRGSAGGGQPMEIVVELGGEKLKRYIVDAVTGEVSFK